MTKHESFAEKFGRFCAFMILTSVVAAFLALSVAFSYWTLSWAFGLR